MKILIISPGAFPITNFQGGAIEKLIENYLNYNEYNDDSITIYSVKIGNNKMDNMRYSNTEFRIIDKTKFKFKILRACYGILNLISKKYIANAYIREIVKDIKSKNELNEYDKIIFENGQNYIPYFKKMLKTNGQLILHLHNDYLNSNTNNGKEIFQFCDEIWTVSKFVKTRVEELSTNENDNKKVKVLYNTIDFSLFERKISSSEKHELQRKFNIEDSFVYLYVGRIMLEKGVEELLRAFMKLNMKYSNIKLLIVGGNRYNDNNDPYLTKLNKLKSKNSNIIMTGFVNTSDLYKYYQLGNIQIIPSLCNEAFGLTVLEGVASDLPIIASNTGGIPEVLEERGKYVRVENLVSDLETEMELALLERKEQKRMTNNYETIKNKFSLKKYCERFYELLSKGIN